MLVGRWEAAVATPDRVVLAVILAVFVWFCSGKWGMAKYARRTRGETETNGWWNKQARKAGGRDSPGQARELASATRECRGKTKTLARQGGNSDKREATQRRSRSDAERCREVQRERGEEEKGERRRGRGKQSQSETKETKNAAGKNRR